MVDYFRKVLYSLIRIFRYFKIKIPLPRDIFELLSYMRSFFIFNISKRNRVLGIIDFNQFNFALGDLTIFHENLIVLREKNNKVPIDICIVEDLSLKKGHSPKKAWAFETLRLNPYIDNVFEFKSRKEYNKFRMNKLHEYVFFPSSRDQFHCDHRPLFNYYNENGSLPKMSTDKTSLDWARDIIQKHVGIKKLIVVQIRNSMGLKNSEEYSNAVKGKTGAALRNSNLPEWQKFFESMDRDKYQVICVCTNDEIIPSWREKDLVLFSKDLGADIMKDFALIECSYLSLFPPSGMFEFGFYSGTPSYVFNPPVGYWKKKGHPIYQLNGGLDDYEQYGYQTQFQKFLWDKKDTFETINYHFNELVKKLKNEGYDDEYQKKINNIEKVMV